MLRRRLDVHKEIVIVQIAMPEHKFGGPQVSATLQQKSRDTMAGTCEGEFPWPRQGHLTFPWPPASQVQTAARAGSLHPWVIGSISTAAICFALLYLVERRILRLRRRIDARAASVQLLSEVAHA